MAGLVAAARARELGASVVVYEKGDRPGGSMLLSSGVVWRFRSLDVFQRECPAGDPVLQQLIVERLDDGLAWLESFGAPAVARHEAGDRVGIRFDPRGLTDALVRAVGEIELGAPFVPADGRLVLATGGFAARLARERGWLLRANPWSEGDALEHARARGAGVAGPLDEFYGRAMPAPPARIDESEYVSHSQLYGDRALAIVNEHGDAFFRDPPSWSENDLAQAIARQPGGRAWYVLDENALADPAVSVAVERARAAGGAVVEPGELPFEVPLGAVVAVHVAAAVTHTIGGVRIDERARILGEDGTPIEGLFAAGVDAGGIATGGYSSGLAQALVFGLIAAETVSG